MTKSFDIHKAAGILLRDKKLLVERSKGKKFFISPGGSVEIGETPRQTLIRELKEEFQIKITEDDLEEFGVFYAQAVDQVSTKIIKMEVFMVKNWVGEINPDSEVEEIAWIDSHIPEGMKVGSIFEHQVIPRLKKANLID